VVRIGVDASFPLSPDETEKVITFGRIFYFELRRGHADTVHARAKTPSPA
jgi:hypothetical protein